MNPTTKRQENENIWRDRIKRIAKRPGTMTEFCQQEGVSKASVIYWRRRFRRSRSSAIVVKPESREQKASPFARVEILDRDQSPRRGQLPDAKWLAELINHLQSGGCV
jgi:transposase-like protein